MPRSRRHRSEEKERYYLLPGQGGKLYQKKQRQIIIWSICAAIFISSIIVAIMFFTDRY